MLDVLLTVAAAAYVACAVALAIFLASFGALLALYLRTRGDDPPLPAVPDADLPSVTVQLPIFNELHVVARLIDACAALDYPAGKLRVQVLDDSTDGTTALLRRRIAYWQERGVRHLALLRRPDRSGYKAGALAYGLARAASDCVAVFDADFAPPPDFLRRTMPFFAVRERLALVQTRSDHRNTGANWLTRANALTVDAHFVVEQTARSRAGLPMSMNGTGGVWRVRALRDAGGWSTATLTEDLDLSYRALLRGWDFLMLPDFGVFGELPPAIQAYKLQQRRWATGMTQNLRRHARALLGARRYSPAAKFMGLMHLSQYAVQPLLLLMFLLTPVLLAGDFFARLPNLSPLGISGIIPLLVMITGQRALHADWPRRLLALPVQGVIGAGMALNNTVGVLAALGPWRAPREFLRTPKFGGEGGGRAWQSSRYALYPDWITLGELVLGAYALLGTALALRTLPALAPYLLTYAAGFWGIAGWNLAQAWSRLRRSPDLSSAEDAEARPA